MIDAGQAREALVASERHNPASAKDRVSLGRGTIGVSVAMALLLLVIRATTGNPDAANGLRIGGFAAGMGLYVVAITVSLVWMLKVKAVPRGFGTSYRWGLGLTCVAYAAFVVIISTMADGSRPTPWYVVILGALATMTPGLLAAHRVSKLPVGSGAGRPGAARPGAAGGTAR